MAVMESGFRVAEFFDHTGVFDHMGYRRRHQPAHCRLLSVAVGERNLLDSAIAQVVVSIVLLSIVGNLYFYACGPRRCALRGGGVFLWAALHGSGQAWSCRSHDGFVVAEAP